MLSLASQTDPSWLAAVGSHLEELLLDHAHCEKKAAAAAMQLLMAYADRRELVLELSEIVVEELDHLRQVMELIERRGIRWRTLRPSNYARQLHALVRTTEPRRAVDLLLVAGLIEARSCERFARLREGLADRELAEFYGQLFESEARHHATYVRLARGFADDVEVATRLDELAHEEAAIIGRGDRQPRMHS